MVGEQAAVGKTLGTDVANQKLTLPIIHCRDNLSEADRAEFVGQLASGSTLDHARLLSWLQKTDSLRFAQEFAREKVAQASKFAQSIKASESATALFNIAEFVLQRTF